jgi:transposase
MGDNRLEPLVLSGAERRTLQGWAARRKTAQGLALRARIVLTCAAGRSNTAVAARLGVSRTTVKKWRARFLASRLDGLGDEPRPGVPRTITDAQVEEVVVRTLEEVPEGATHWSKRELAKRVGISPTSVHRIWRSFGLQPWRTEEFKVSPEGLVQPRWAPAATPRTVPVLVSDMSLGVGDRLKPRRLRVRSSSTGDASVSFPPFVLGISLAMATLLK